MSRNSLVLHGEARWIPGGAVREYFTGEGDVSPASKVRQSLNRLILTITVTVLMTKSEVPRTR